MRLSFTRVTSRGRNYGNNKNRRRSTRLGQITEEVFSRYGLDEDIYNKVVNRLDELMDSKGNYFIDFQEVKYIHHGFEKINGRIMYPSIMNDLIKNMKRIPTPREYVDETVKITKEILSKEMKAERGYIQLSSYSNEQVYINLNNEELIKGIKGRALRSYTSVLVEYVTKIILLIVLGEDNIKISSGDIVDYGLGVDLVLVDKKRDNGVKHLYVLVDTKNSHEYRDIKQNKKGYIEVGNNKMVIDRSRIPEESKQDIRYTKYIYSKDYVMHNGLVLPNLEDIKKVIDDYNNNEWYEHIETSLFLETLRRYKDATSK